VGKGVRVETGVAVKRGVMLTIGARVAVAGKSSWLAPPVQAAKIPKLAIKINRK